MRQWKSMDTPDCIGKNDHRCPEKYCHLEEWLRISSRKKRKEEEGEGEERSLLVKKKKTAMSKGTK